MYIDGYYLILIALFIVSMIVSGSVKRRFKAYSSVPVRYSGAEVAGMILRNNGIYDVNICVVEGSLSDNYNPSSRTLNLSKDVAYGKNVSAVAVAAHECGHAIQHAQNYFPVLLRKTLVPAANICSNISYILILAGLFLQSFSGLITIGALIFGVVVLVHLVTLPVEFNASRRAMAQLRDMSVFYEGDDISGAGKVLTAAALTYVVAFVSSLVQFLRLLSIAANRRRRN